MVALLIAATRHIWRDFRRTILLPKTPIRCIDFILGRSSSSMSVFWAPGLSSLHGSPTRDSPGSELRSSPKTVPGPGGAKVTEAHAIGSSIFGPIAGGRDAGLFIAVGHRPLTGLKARRIQ